MLSGFPEAGVTLGEILTTLGGYLNDDRSPLTPEDVARMIYNRSKDANGEARPEDIQATLASVGIDIPYERCVMVVSFLDKDLSGGVGADEIAEFIGEDGGDDTVTPTDMAHALFAALDWD